MKEGINFCRFDKNDYEKLMSPVRAITRADGKKTDQKINLIHFVFKTIGNFFQRLVYLLSCKYNAWQTDSRLVKQLRLDAEDTTHLKINEIKFLYRSFKLRLNKKNEDMLAIREILKRNTEKLIPIPSVKEPVQVNSVDKPSLEDPNKNSKESINEVLDLSTSYEIGNSDQEATGEDIFSEESDEEGFGFEEYGAFEQEMMDCRADIEAGDYQEDGAETLGEQTELSSEETVANADQLFLDALPTAQKQKDQEEKIEQQPSFTFTTRLKQGKQLVRKTAKRALKPTVPINEALLSEKKSSKHVRKVSSFSHVTSKNILEILELALSGDSGKVWDAALKKYGPKILNSNFLKAGIEKITDPNIKKSAQKAFVKLQLNMLAHNFSIGGVISIRKNAYNVLKRLKSKYQIGASSQVKLEGNWQYKTQVKITSSFISFIKKESILTKFLSEDELNEIAEALVTSCKTSNNEEYIQNLLDRMNRGEMWTCPVGWSGHATSLTGWGSILAYANQGQRSELKEAGIQLFRVDKTQKIDVPFFKSLLKGMNEPAEKMMKFYEDEDFDQGIHQQLSLRNLTFINKKNQTVGNCSWVTAQDQLETLIYFSIVKKMTAEFKQVLIEFDGKKHLDNIYIQDAIFELNFTDKNLNPEDLQKVKDKSLAMCFEADQKTPKRGHRFLHDTKDLAKKCYREWHMDHTLREMDDFLELLRDWNQGKSIFSGQEEFKLISELSKKFTAQRKQDLYKDNLTFQEVFQKFEQIVCTNTFSIEETIISLEKLSFQGRLRYIRDLLHNKIDGTFIVFKDEDFKSKFEIKVAFMVDGHCHEFPVKEAFVDKKIGFSIESKDGSIVVESLKDLENHLKILLDLEGDVRLKYPVYDNNLMLRYIEGQEHKQY